ncbi:hypothetical protein [uncultured Actinomyces sp.]|uniref:hypothetical protein n=1 Tax=uncultured Actinomyces sp. TaxID=249061 RepID=UPI0028DC9B2B|nr:hypothetical protein [uncultured Actinomyces sp.]
MDANTLLVALLLALACAVLLLPARREIPAGPRRRPAPASRGASTPEVDIGLLLTEVATLLRAGATPSRAWGRTLERAGVTQGAQPGPDGTPPALASLAAIPSAWLPRRHDGRWTWQLPRGPAEQRRRALRAAVPGALAACRLTQVLGAPLAGILEAVAAGVAESGRAQASRAAALSGPRTTARLLAALPLLGLALGAMVGARPLDVLLDGGWGSTLGLVGLGLMGLGHVLTRRLVQAAERRQARVDEALVLDLASAALAAGASVPGVLEALGPAVEDDDLGVVGRALVLGADWEEAWRAPEDDDLGGRYRRLEGCLRPGWEDGASPGPLLAATAACVRDGRAAADEEAAQRLAVRLVVPLGLCHLPAFVLLGIVPVIVSVGAGLVGG